MFLDRDNKKKLVMVLFLTFQKSYERKIIFSLKSVIVITVMRVITFNYFCIMKKRIKQFYFFCTWKRIVEKSHQENLKATKNTWPNTSGNPESTKNVFQLMCTQLARGCCVISTGCFVYGFLFQVIREKRLCSKDSIRHLREFLYEMKITVTIIPTNLVTNSLLSLSCPLVETKNKNQVLSKLVVW